MINFSIKIAQFKKNRLKALKIDESFQPRSFKNMIVELIQIINF